MLLIFLLEGKRNGTATVGEKACMRLALGQAVRLGRYARGGIDVGS